MIYRIYSSLPTFKALELHNGLNLLLADKSPGATERQTRNGAGKTSLIELIHFLLGANCDKDSLFRSKFLNEFSFGMELDVGGSRVRVERSGQSHSKLQIDLVGGNEWSSWPISPSRDKKAGRSSISNTNWRVDLGSQMFGLGAEDSEDQSGKFGPTFRSLFAYFVRRQMANGFVSPVKQADMQQLGDQQVAISYLLDLDWTIPQQWQVVRDREKSLKEIKRAAAEGTFGALIGSAAELRTRLTVAEEKTKNFQEILNDFRVLPQYRQLESEASSLTVELGRLADENTIDRQLVLEVEQSLQNEQPPSIGNLEELYEEVGITLPETVTRRFDEVKAFHESVIQNRRSYLEGEIQSAQIRLDSRSEQMQRLDARRSELMGILKAHGALDQFIKLQSEFARQEAETESIRQQYSTAVQLESQKAELEIERARLLRRLQQDHREQEESIRKAILAFEKTSSALYEMAGSLTISETLNGPEFRVTIQGSKSKGINNMQVFCFDMMLMKLCAEKHSGPDFLIHDSHLFDGVDERQVSRALQVAAETSNELGFQYIVTMNSDAVPRDLPQGFDLQKFILPVRLTDATDTGGLFGMRF